MYYLRDPRRGKSARIVERCRPNRVSRKDASREKAALLPSSRVGLRE